jgi:uncharacterized membrane protein YhdT
MRFNSTAHKWFGGFVLAYIVLSIPLHVATYFTNSTEALTVFPLWFSIVLLPYYAAAIVFLWRLQFKSDAQ